MRTGRRWRRQETTPIGDRLGMIAWLILTFPIYVWLEIRDRYALRRVR